MQAAPTERSPARRWLHEPLLHFGILGACLFVLYRLAAPPPPSRRIVLDAEVVRGLRQDFAQRNGAPPSADEENALLQRHVDNEVLYREALRLGLDRGDVIVRRRLVQKMEFLNENSAPIPEPRQAELEAFVDAHPQRYFLPERVTIEQVFVATERHREDLSAAARLVAERLAAGEDPESLGDPFLRGRVFPLHAEQDLAAIFGAGFAAAALRLTDGKWSDPLPSRYGLHVVRVTAREPARRPALPDIREAVLREWTEERRGEATRAALDRIRQSYSIVVENAAPDPPARTAAGDADR